MNFSKVIFWKVLFRGVLFLLLITTVNASFLDWFWSGSQDVQNVNKKVGEIPEVKIPFEVNTEDEKFLEEAQKYTSLKLSDLDSCQHHIVMQIRNSCADMTEEDLSKMSVNLLNCQSAVEGRQQYPCTKKMSLRECTSAMDPDMWNTYHLMNNRARAVCYAARHQQFRALSEMTVNKLMETASHQLDTMTKLTAGQTKLESLATHTMETLVIGHKDLLDEQEKLRATQHSLQDFVALNLRQLTREKALIAAGQQELAKMTGVVSKLELNTEDIIAQLQAASAQYEEALQKLAQINSTVNFLLAVMDKTRHELDERLGWITGVVGGTGGQLDRLFSCLEHGLFLVAGMITTSFVRAPTLTRACLVAMVPLNLAVSYHQGDAAALNFPSLTILLAVSAAVHWLIQAALELWRVPPVPSPVLTAEKHTQSWVDRLWGTLQSKVKHANSTVSSWASPRPVLHDDESSDTDDIITNTDLDSPLMYKDVRHRQRSTTPLLFNVPPTPTRTSSRSGTPRPVCRAICRSGQPCRNSATADHDLCHRHAMTDSY